MFEPVVPPRSSCVDASHYAAVLCYLDGADRLSWALASDEREAQGFYALWAVRAFVRAEQHLAASNVARAARFSSRPEFMPEMLVPRIMQLRQQALALVPRECFVLRLAGDFMILGAVPTA